MKKLLQTEAGVSQKPPRLKGNLRRLQEMLDRELLEGAKEKDRFLAMGKVTAALDGGANIEATDENGMTALMHASKNLNDHAGVILVSRGAERSKKDKSGREALDHLNESEREAGDPADGIYPPPGSILKAVLQNGIENFNPAWFA